MCRGFYSEVPGRAFAGTNTRTSGRASYGQIMGTRAGWVVGLMECGREPDSGEGGAADHRPGELDDEGGTATFPLDEPMLPIPNDCIWPMPDDCIWPTPDDCMTPTPDDCMRPTPALAILPIPDGAAPPVPAGPAP